MDTSAIDSQFPKEFYEHVSSDSVDKRVRWVYRELRKFASSSKRKDWLESREKAQKVVFDSEFFDDNDKQDMAKMGQPEVPINKCVTGVSDSAAVATANKPEIKAFPLRDSDPYLAELVKNGIDYVWLHNYGNDVIFDGVEERMIGGIGVFEGYHDPNKGPLGSCVIEEGEPDCWYWDENSRKRDRSDTHLIKAKMRSVEYIKETYDLPDEKILTIGSSPRDDKQASAMEDTLTSGDNYKHASDAGVPPDGTMSNSVWEIEAHMRKVAKEHWAVAFPAEGSPATMEPFLVVIEGAESRNDVKEAISSMRSEGIPRGDMVIPVKDVKYWPRRVTNRIKLVIVGDQLIDQAADSLEDHEPALEMVNPLGMDSDGDPVLPVVFYYAQRTGKAYYRSPTYYAAPINTSLCKREAQFIFAISKNLNAPVVREQGTYWSDSDRPDRPGNELVIGTASRVPTRLQPGAVDLRGLQERILHDERNIDDAYGQTEVAQGKVPQNLERMSGRLGLALQDSSYLMQSPAIRGLESALERLGKVILAIILDKWPRSKWLSLISNDKVRSFVPDEESNSPRPNPNENPEAANVEFAKRRQHWLAALDKLLSLQMNVADFQVRITAGSSLPTNRMFREEMAIEKYRIGLYDRRAALEHSDDPYAVETADRIDKREIEMAQVAGKAGGK